MPRSTCTVRALTLALATLLTVTGCRLYGSYDAIAKQEDKACLVPEKLTAVSPPLKTFVDQGIAIDYDKFVPRPNPRKNVDMDYANKVRDDSKTIEQVYYDASQGNARARWLVCIYEVAARFMGREAARHLASLKCQTVANCSVKFDKLPFSHDTASGLRLLGQVGGAFETHAKSEGAKLELVENALILLVGIKASTALRTPKVTSPKPSATTARPPDRVAKQPYNPHIQRAELEAANPGKVSSTTVPDPKHPSVKPPEAKRTPGKPARDMRGFPIFDDVAVYDTRLPKAAWSGKSSGSHMRAATRDLQRAIDAGEVNASQFTPKQLKAIKDGNAKIPGYTWHHHPDPGRMQLIPEMYHKQSGHVGGAKLWGKPRGETTKTK